MPYILHTEVFLEVLYTVAFKIFWEKQLLNAKSYTENVYTTALLNSQNLLVERILFYKSITGSSASYKTNHRMKLMHPF